MKSVRGGGQPRCYAGTPLASPVVRLRPISLATATGLVTPGEEAGLGVLLESEWAERAPDWPLLLRLQLSGDGGRPGDTGLGA